MQQVQEPPECRSRVQLKLHSLQQQGVQVRPVCESWWWPVDRMAVGISCGLIAVITLLHIQTLIAWHTAHGNAPAHTDTHSLQHAMLLQNMS